MAGAEKKEYKQLPQGEFKPSERSIYLNCQLKLVQDLILVLMPRYGADPIKIPLKAGTNLTLVDDRQMFCATEEGCGNGPLVRVDETPVAGQEINEQRCIGQAYLIPARFLAIHPDVL